MSKSNLKGKVFWDSYHDQYDIVLLEDSSSITSYPIHCLTDNHGKEKISRYIDKGIQFSGYKVDIEYSLFNDGIVATGEFGIIVEKIRLPIGYEYSSDNHSKRIELAEAIKSISRQLKKRKKSIEKAVVNFDMIPASVVPEPEILTSNGSIEEQYIAISSNISDLTKGINTGNILSDMKEVGEAFESTRSKLISLSDSKRQEPSVISRKLTSWTAGTFLESTAKKVTGTVDFNSSVQDNIDYLFGMLNTKYETMVTTGEMLQNSKAMIVKQIKALQELLIESNNELNSYTEATDIPMRVLSTNNQIKSSINKFQIRIEKINGAIIAMQATILELSKDLPGMRSDLIDEMALGSLLTDVTKYQDMYKSVSDMISGIVETTAEQTHEAVESLMDMQIANTSTIDYLEKSAKRGENFALMLDEKTNILKDKVLSDSKRIEVITGTDRFIEHSGNGPIKINFKNTGPR